MIDENRNKNTFGLDAISTAELARQNGAQGPLTNQALKAQWARVSNNSVDHTSAFWELVHEQHGIARPKSF